MTAVIANMSNFMQLLAAKCRILGDERMEDDLVTAQLLDDIPTTDSIVMKTFREQLQPSLQSFRSEFASAQPYQDADKDAPKVPSAVRCMTPKLASPVTMQPLGETQFFQLHKELFGLHYNSSGSGTGGADKLITTINNLNEKITATKIEMTDEKRALLCLSMAIADHGYDSLTQLWSITPSMSFDKAAAMLRDEERHQRKNTSASNDTSSNESKTSCKTCKRKYGMVCWKERPDLAPKWYKTSKKKRKHNVSDVSF
ncbi:hypothetical protein LTR37_017002 [Vermiconidia calcicola]|uniref:Uncharacterized protein n=1 Tax=Vermiconidia calcicola TaxID=1690605 RepID=A0ACC3ML53_9PEZI|nr:hypothetical protein LTR37_017002 [Vermiconidia calcicola]